MYNLYAGSDLSDYNKLARLSQTGQRTTQKSHGIEDLTKRLIKTFLYAFNSQDNIFQAKQIIEVSV